MVRVGLWFEFFGLAGKGSHRSKGVPSKFFR